MSIFSRINIGMPNDDEAGMNRRIADIERLLSELFPYDATVKTPQGAIRMMILGQEIGLGELEGGEGGMIAFRLSASVGESGATYRVSSKYSTITDGTNGAAIDLSGIGMDTSRTLSGSGDRVRHIYLSAAVNPATGAASAWELQDSADPLPEVEFDEAPDDDDQIGLHLFIGKITIADGAASVLQGTASAQLLDWGFANGVSTRVLLPHTVHPSAS